MLMRWFLVLVVGAATTSFHGSAVERPSGSAARDYCVGGRLGPARQSRGTSVSEVKKGIVAFQPTEPQDNIPKTYRLTKHNFPYEMEKYRTFAVSETDVYRVRFPSPFTSPHKENNTVHAEYYRPHGIGPFPAAVVLHITGGDQSLSRFLARHLARHKIAALFMQMAYYGPRRPPNSKIRMLSVDVKQTVSAVKQTVLDVRRATAWLESRPEIDGKRLGVLGTSLGSFVAALSSEMEPKLKRVVVLLGGGGFVDAYYDHPKAAPFRAVWETIGGTKAAVAKMIAPVDPLTRADLLKNRSVFMVAAKKDQIVLPQMAKALWTASGKQKILWLDANHYTAALYLLTGLPEIVEHLGKK